MPMRFVRFLSFFLAAFSRFVLPAEVSFKTSSQIRVGLLLATCLGLSGPLGCYSQTKPSPSVVARGSVIYLQLGPDGLAGAEGLQSASAPWIPLGTVGYGGKILAEHAGKYDLQRGWLVFSLVPVSGTGGPQELTTLAVSRVQGDPATILARNGAKGFPSLDAPYGSGYLPLNSRTGFAEKWPYSSQIVAMVEIPDDPIHLPDGEYTIAVVNRRGTTSGVTPCIPSASCTETVVNFSEFAGAIPRVYVKGSVLDVPWSHPEDEVLDVEQLNLGGVFGEDRAFHPKDGIVDLYPDPKMTVELPGVQADSLPAAAHIVLNYPTTKISQIYSVFADNHAGRTSTVVWSVPAPGTLVIDVADLEQSVRWLSFAFEPTSAVLANPIDPLADLTVVSQAYYDATGAAITGPEAVLEIEKDIR